LGVRSGARRGFAKVADCRIGGAWFVLGVHARMRRPGPDGGFGRAAAARRRGTVKDDGSESFYLHALASGRGRWLVPTACHGDWKKFGEGLSLVRGDLRF